MLFRHMDLSAMDFCSRIPFGFSFTRLTLSIQGIQYLRVCHTIYGQWLLGEERLQLITVEILIKNYTEKQALSHLGRNAKNKKKKNVF